MSGQPTKAGKTRIEVHRDKCRHFSGIQHDVCKVGVRYLDVRDDSRPARFACLDTGRGAPDTCPRRSLLTQEEHDEQNRELDAAVDRMLAANAAGKCHQCGADIEPSRIVGRCKYAACGHRIGQVAGAEP